MNESACQAMAFQVLDQLSRMYQDLGIEKTAADFKSADSSIACYELRANQRNELGWSLNYAFVAGAMIKYPSFL